MKKMICLLLSVLVICGCLCSCGSEDTAENQENTSSTEVSESDILTEDKAKEKATEKLYTKLEAMYYGSKYVNVSETKYKVTSITGSASEGYTLYGDYILYDHYGKVHDTQTFKVFVDSNGVANIEEY